MKKAEPDDPLYQRQGNPVDRISIRALRVGGQTHETANEAGAQTEEIEGEELHPGRQGDSGLRRVHESELWRRGAYDAEAEERRRANLGLPMSAWDRYMTRRGPRRNYGGTWVMMDSEGLHFISHDPGDGLGSGQASDSGARGSGGDGGHRDEHGATGGGGQPSGDSDRPRERPESTLPRVEPLRLITTVDEGVVLGKWCHEEEMWDYLKGFINEAVLKVISTPPPRTSAKDSWEYLIDHDGGRKIAIRAHHQPRKKLYDFEAKVLLEEEWGRWRMTVAWPVIGKRKTILVDERNGRRGIHLDTWWGYSLFRTP